MKLIKKFGLNGIDKTEIDELIAAKKFIGLNNSPRAEKIIVSFTSYKPRINDVKYTIYSLLNQTFAPDKLILWLDEDSFPQREENLPQDLLELRNFGLTIDWCENLRPYKKLIPALEKYPDDIIVTADDDIFYRPDWLKILYDEHLKSPDCLIAHRAHRIRLDAQGNLFPYLKWIMAEKSFTPCYENFFTGAGGVLYKKKFFHEDILRRDIFMEVSPNNDDIWFWAMAVLNGTKIKIPSKGQRYLIYDDIDMQRGEETLWSKNKNGNDVQLKQVIERYPALLDKLIREDADSKPALSVIVLLKNADKLNECLNNFFAQRFADFELIVINVGARVQLPTLPTNFHVINYPGGNINDAFNLGLRKAAGDYVLFKDADSILTGNALEIVAQSLNSADVIHFAGHFQSDGKIIQDDKVSFNNEQKIFLDELKQTRALLWSQNKLSERLDTKIFRRELLIGNEINFDKGITEFLFRALIRSEKYLIVPQAFCSCKEQNE